MLGKIAKTRRREKMSGDYLFESEKDTRHKVFVSYYHNDDEKYREKFEELFWYL